MIHPVRKKTYSYYHYISDNDDDTHTNKYKQGADWAAKYVRVLFQLFGRSMELEANRPLSEIAEPSNLLESMLGTLLVFVRECPEVCT